MANTGKEQGSDSFMETKAGPIVFTIVLVVGFWFLIWFGNYIPNPGNALHH